MRIEFFDNPLQVSRSREEVRFNQIGIYLFEDQKRVAVGFDITPFSERPSIDVSIINKKGAEEASLSIIEAMQTNFSLTMHLRQPDPNQTYAIIAVLYYRDMEGNREIVDTINRDIDLSVVGEQ